MVFWISFYCVLDNKNILLCLVIICSIKFRFTPFDIDHLHGNVLFSMQGNASVTIHRFPKSNVVTEANYMKPNDKMKLPKSKLNDFHTLLIMGFDKKEIIKDLDATEIFAFALDKLTNQKSARKIQADLHMEEKERMKGNDAAQQDHGMQIDGEDENYGFWGEF